MSGYSVMLRKPGQRAKPMYPLYISFTQDGKPRCSGMTVCSTDSMGFPGRPCEFLRRDDADWFADFMRGHYEATNRDYDVFVQPRGVSAGASA